MLAANARACAKPSKARLKLSATHSCPVSLVASPVSRLISVCCRLHAVIPGTLNATGLPFLEEAALHSDRMPSRSQSAAQGLINLRAACPLPRKQRRSNPARVRQEFECLSLRVEAHRPVRGIVDDQPYNPAEGGNAALRLFQVHSRQGLPDVSRWLSSRIEIDAQQALRPEQAGHEDRARDAALGLNDRVRLERRRSIIDGEVHGFAVMHLQQR